MIVLDTNVISEAMKNEPSRRVRQWLNQQSSRSLYLSSVTLAEMLFGIAALPTGKRKERLALAFDSLRALFDQRTLPFDADAARHYAPMAINAREAGRQLPLPDGYIAAIASQHGFTVATRDTTPFETAGVPVVNPWQAA